VHQIGANFDSGERLKESQEAGQYNG